MSKLHKALSESPNVLTARHIRRLKSLRDTYLSKRDKLAREYVEELDRALKLARESKRNRKACPEFAMMDYMNFPFQAKTAPLGKPMGLPEKKKRKGAK
jgi:hypothetical protein